MRIAMVTPTYAADIERFSTLRASLDAVNCTWPHYVVVQTEDLGLFRQLALSPAVTLLSSADVLPATVETARRRLSGYSHRRRVLRRSLNKRFGWFADATCDGWHAQQLIKLMLASKLDADVVLTIDSDVIACRHPDAVSFARDGQVALHCSPAAAHAHFQPHWNRAARKVLHLLPAATEYNYVAHPFSISPPTMRALQAHLEQRHSKSWWQALLAMPPGDLSEFTVYGIFAREIAALEGLFEQAANAKTRWVYTAEDRAQVSEIIAKTFLDQNIDYLVLQASRNWPLTPYLPLLEKQFARHPNQAA